jgi:branched-chain amino acid transport system permease protein
MGATEWLQFTLAGVTLGGVYALVALSFTITYNGCGIVNFAQGEFVMIGGMTAAAAGSVGVPPVLAGLLAVAIVMVVAAVMYAVTLDPLRNPSPTTLILVTIGASLVLSSVALYVFGTQTKSLDPFVSGKPLNVFGAVISLQALFVMVACVLLMVLLYAFFRHTGPGQKFIATSDNREGAKLVGNNTRAVSFATFILAGALGAIAGVLVMPLTAMAYGAGLLFTIKGFSAAVLGGFGSVAGAVVGGLVLGLAEAYAAALLSSGYQAIATYGLLALVLLLRPGGILGSRELAH